MLDFSKNYFELFGLPVGYILDGATLTGHYRELQRVIHPDRFANASPKERRLSVQAASHINEAYEILKDPIARAGYLLSLQGVELDLSQNQSQDMEFLMQQMSMRERLSAIRDETDPLTGLDQFKSDIGAQINGYLGQLAVQFESKDAGELDEIKDILFKLQFLQRLRQEADALEADLEEELI